ncbi:MAG: elongation factor G [Phycisphaeraceae bacterium]|nr:elongation factor G [Phycisphaerae bacterium]MBX3393286.1 elongation factor G [Phycisphaeraceae bacterium]
MGTPEPRSPADIRNILLCGSAGGGKTTLTERLLFGGGVIKRLGTVDEGNTHSDFTEEERHHKHSLQPAFFHFDWEGHEVHLIDSPGLSDFLGHTIACFPAVETVAVVIDASKGIQSVSRRLMAVAKERGIPCMVIVNKIDDLQADLEMLTEQIRESFGHECLPINLPVPGRGDVINVFEHDGTDARGDAAEFLSVHEAHKRIVEQVIEVDDELTMQYLEKGDGAFDPEKLHAAFEKALGEGHLVPICYCSAKTGTGCSDLMHVFASLCPSPVEVNPPEFYRRESADGEEHVWHATPDPSAKALAHIFKVTTDPFVGKLAIFRVHQGTVRHKADFFIDDQKKPFKVGHLFKLQGKEHVEVHEVGPGEIAGVSKVDEVRFNGVIHDSHELDSVRLIPLPLPGPMYGLAIELKNHADEAKFAAASHKMMAEDPSLVIERIAAIRQTVMRGLGELHLRVVIEKFKHAYNLELITSQPKVAYKETITANADGHHRHKKQTGGAGQFGEVYLRVMPLPPDHAEGFEFANATVGGSIPRQFIPAVEKGVRMMLSEGAVAGYPMTGIRVEVYDGKYHDVDSKEIAFITAGKKAFIDAVQKARPVLLEPFVHLEITAPSRYMGDLAGHLSTKRGRVQSSDVLGGDVCVVKAVAPLGELQNYANELKSMTGGAGSYTMEYSHDEHTPGNIQAAVVAAYKPKADEE